MPFQTDCRKLASISRRCTQVKQDRWGLPACGKNTIIAGITTRPKSLTIPVLEQFAAFSEIPSGARDLYSLRQSLEADRSVHLGMKSSVENLELVEEKYGSLATLAISERRCKTAEPAFKICAPGNTGRII